MNDWTLITDVMGIEVLKCAMNKEKSKWLKENHNTVVNCEWNTS